MPANDGPAASLRSISVALRVLVFGIAFAVLLWLFVKVLLLAFFGLLLAVFLRRVSARLARLLRVPDRGALALLVIALLAAGGGGVYWFGPIVMLQGQELSGQLFNQVETLRARYGEGPAGTWIFQHLSNSQVHDTPVLTATSSTLDVTSIVVVVVVTALYFAAAPDLYVSGLVRLVPLDYRPRARQLLSRLGKNLWLWLIGQGIDMLAVGTLAAVGLSIVGVPLPILLGVITGLLAFIPYFGAVAGAIPAILLGLTVSGHTALLAFLVYVGCHIFEGYVVAPLVQSRMVHLPPALTILSLTLFGSLIGPLGIVLATPLAVTCLVIVQQLYVKDMLHDPAMPSDD